ncbi:MAG TPA: L,D-transpeptidase, partial [Gemmatimonadaceae bacterium]
MTTRTERPAASSGAAGHAPYTRDRRSRRTTYGTGVALFLSCVGGATGMFAQEPGTGSYAPGDAVPPAYRSSADSLASMKVRAEAAVARGLHVEVSLLDRMVWVIREGDTLVRAEAAVASGMTIEFAGRSWTFRTPRGRHSVLRKLEQPVWTPPDWLYAEAALEHGLELEPLSPGASVPLRDGLHLVVRENRVGVLN